jgi:hypothetical protein
VALVRVEGAELVVALTRLEKLAALRSDVRVPVAAVASVEVVADGVSTVRGARAPGTAWPGGPRIGTWRRRDGRTFAVARPGRPAVRVRLSGDASGFTELVVTVDDPAAAVAAVSAAR